MFIRFAHLSTRPDLELEVLLDGAVVVPALARGDASAYIPVAMRRSARIEVRARGASSNDLVDLTLHHAELKRAYYTAALSDPVGGAARSLLATLYEDMGVQQRNAAAVRFVALSPDAGPLDVKYAIASEQLEYESHGHAFTDASAYHRVATPGKPYVLSVQLPAKGKEFVEPRAAFQSDMVYTVYAIGKVADGSFQTVILTDKHHGANSHHNTYVD